MTFFSVAKYLEASDSCQLSRLPDEFGPPWHRKSWAKSEEASSASQVYLFLYPMARVSMTSTYLWIEFFLGSQDLQ